jgi:transposase
MGGAVAITRVDLTAAQLRAAAGREKDGSAARRMLALAMVLDGAERKSAAETCGMDRQTLRDWVHRYNAEGLRGLHDVKTPSPKPKLTAEQQIELARLVEAGPDPPVTEWCAGGAWICGTNWNDASVSCCTNARLASCWQSSATACSPCVRAIHRPTKRPRRRLKKLRRDRHGAASRARQRQGDRNLVPGRSAHRSARDADPRLGQARNAAACATRPTLRVGLHFWRRLSATPRYGRARPARCRYRCNVHASGRNRPPRRAGSACCARHRWWRLSRRGATRRSTQHHARPPAALRSRTEPARECLGISARQQTRHHRVRKLRRHRRQILHRVALLRRRPRTRRLNHVQNLGDGHSLRPLVLFIFMQNFILLFKMVSSMGFFNPPSARSIRACCFVSHLKSDNQLRRKGPVRS